jgi:hypothetical protein
LARTGDLLLDPIVPDNALDFNTFVNQNSREWIEAQAVWPTGSFASSTHFFDVMEVKEAVAEWVRFYYFLIDCCGQKPFSFKISGKDILPLQDVPSSLSLKGKEPKRGGFDEVQVTFVYEGQATVWDLSISTSTRTLYCLANRATKARYSRFTIRLMSSKANINDSANLTLGLTDLSHGGVVEISFAVVHKRRLSEVIVRRPLLDYEQKILLPQDAPILALIGYLEPTYFGSMSDVQLWYVSDVLHLRWHDGVLSRHGLKDSGDGVRRGSTVKNINTLSSFGYNTTYEFECEDWTWRVGGVQKERETSRYLNRLDILKELFNVFINRAVGPRLLFGYGLGLTLGT